MKNRASSLFSSNEPPTSCKKINKIQLAISEKNLFELGYFRTSSIKVLLSTLPSISVSLITSILFSAKRGTFYIITPSLFTFLETKNKQSKTNTSVIQSVKTFHGRGIPLHCSWICRRHCKRQTFPYAWGSRSCRKSWTMINFPGMEGRVSQAIFEVTGMPQANVPIENGLPGALAAGSLRQLSQAVTAYMGTRLYQPLTEKLCCRPPTFWTCGQQFVWNELKSCWVWSSEAGCTSCWAWSSEAGCTLLN